MRSKILELLKSFHPEVDARDVLGRLNIKPERVRFLENIIKRAIEEEKLHASELVERYGHYIDTDEEALLLFGFLSWWIGHMQGYLESQKTTQKIEEKIQEQAERLERLELGLKEKRLDVFKEILQDIKNDN